MSDEPSPDPDERTPFEDQAHPIGVAHGAGADAPRRSHRDLEVEAAGDDEVVAEALVADRGRPLVERIGMAAIAIVLAALFGGVALAAFSGGEPFLGVMAAVGCLMTLWVGALTLFRG
jgi:hypothetical protein